MTRGTILTGRRCTLVDVVLTVTPFITILADALVAICGILTASTIQA